jgi:hypothetical protein
MLWPQKTWIENGIGTSFQLLFPFRFHLYCSMG